MELFFEVHLAAHTCQEFAESRQKLTAGSRDVPRSLA